MGANRRCSSARRDSRWTINQGAENDRYQPLRFVIDSFEHLFALEDRLEEWMRAGRMDQVAPGLPEVSTKDLASFLEAAERPA